MRKPISAALLVFVGFLSPGIGTPAVPANVGAGSRNQIYSSVKDLMDAIIDPSADVLWGAAGTVVDKDGTHDLSPKTDDDWLNVRRAAIRLIEGANLLMMPGRLAAPPGSKSEAPGADLEPAQIVALMRQNRRSFDTFAKALQGIGLESLQASERSDADALIGIGARMDSVCESCHQVFWYPEENKQ